MMNPTPNPRTDLFTRIFVSLHDHFFYDEGELRYLVLIVAEELSDGGLEMLISDLKKLLKLRKEQRRRLKEAVAKIMGATKVSKRGDRRTVGDLVKLLKDLSTDPRKPSRSLPTSSTESKDTGNRREEMPPAWEIVTRRQADPTQSRGSPSGGGTGGKGEEKEVVEDEEYL